VAGATPEQADRLDKKQKKKKDKVRSAWISFVGRIVAQVMGAAATIVLGLVVLQKYQGASAPATNSPNQPPAVEQVVVPARTPRLPGELSLAVLPLETYAARPQGHLADGITEAVISDLSGIKGLGVRSRTSVMPYRDQRKSLPVIARELGVDLIVEGSVTTSGNRARIIVQLIDTKSDEHIWAQSSPLLTDVLAVQAGSRQDDRAEHRSAHCARQQRLSLDSTCNDGARIHAGGRRRGVAGGPGSGAADPGPSSKACEKRREEEAQGVGLPVGRSPVAPPGRGNARRFSVPRPVGSETFRGADSR
jgi:TolB-like protein